jgi:acyl-coenzyme A thioesterase PaaI-like protein
VSEPEQSLQDRYSPQSRCFGCGPANDQGLRIKSLPAGSEVVCEWTPAPHHDAFDGFLNGGIIGVLFDCHCNWTAMHHLISTGRFERLPCTVTSEFHVFLKKPTPSGGPVRLRARVVDSAADRVVTVEGELEAGGTVTATARGVFVAVREGHPAYHRW